MSEYLILCDRKYLVFWISSNVTDYVDSHAPDSSLGFGDTKTGSNVLDVIDVSME